MRAQPSTITAATIFCLLSVVPVWSKPLSRFDGAQRPREMHNEVVVPNVETNSDSTPPSLDVHVPEQVSGLTFGIGVDARDRGGIATVSVSLDGIVVATRTDEPFRFQVTAAQLPVRVKVLATDRHGNAASVDRVVDRMSDSCICPQNFDPVCGVDGKTYGNECEARCAGVRIRHQGVCEVTGCIGADGQSCQEGEFCELALGQCGTSNTSGSCIPRPEACPRNFAPVCGCDGQTYSNDCTRQSAGVSLRHAGACEKLVCGGPIARPFDCPEGQYCETPGGQCAGDVTGFCEERPMTCPLRPGTDAEVVCGCDGNTYSTDCERRQAGVGLAKRGKCEDPNETFCGGIAGIPCPSGQTCDMRDPTCQLADGGGQCVPLPDACPEIYAPVCACDGQTYGNDCERLRAGATLSHRGPCDETKCPGSIDAAEVLGRFLSEAIKCRVDADCVTVRGFECCCSALAVNRLSTPLVERLRTSLECCRDVACIAVLCEHPGEPVCANGECRLQK